MSDTYNIGSRDYPTALRALYPYLFRWETDKDYNYTGNVVAMNRDYQIIPKTRLKFKRNPAYFKDIWWNNEVYEFTTMKDKEDLFLYSGYEGSRNKYWTRLGKLFSHSHTLLPCTIPWKMTTEDYQEEFGVDME